MKRRAFLLAFLVIALSVSSTPTAADTSAKFDYHIADSFIEEGTGIPQTGAVARADNGDTVTVTGAGTFNVASGNATGGGTFVHRRKNGKVVGSGTWTATSAVNYTSFGCGGGFPPNFCGGVLVLNVHLVGGGGTVEFDGVMAVTCTIGTVPPGAVEGITLDVPAAGINFDETIFDFGGLTLFVSRSFTPGG